MSQQTGVYNDVFEILPDENNSWALVRVNRLNPAPNFTLYAKLEWLNPFGSVKDRAAWFMLFPTRHLRSAPERLAQFARVPGGKSERPVVSIGQLPGRISE